MQSRIIFTPEEKEEDIQLVLQGIKNKQTYKQISRDIGRSPQYISNIKKILIGRGLITQDDIDSIFNSSVAIYTLKPAVLEKFHEGKSMQKIADELNTSRSTVSTIRDLLIQEGLLTLEKINEANKKSSDRKTLKLKILQGFESGIRSSEMSSQLRVPKTTISRIKRELISEGLITEQEISEAIIKRELNQSNSSCDESSSPKNSTSDENIGFSQLGEREKQIIDFLFIGYPLAYISNQLSIDSFDLTEIINNLKKNKYISVSQISTARKSFKQDEEKKVLFYLRKGYSKVEILQELPYLTRTTLYRDINSLISSGQITQEEIEIAQREASQNHEKVVGFVLEKLKLGFNVGEIIAADENNFLTEGRVRNITKKLISRGAISLDKIEQARGKRSSKKKADDYAACDKKILAIIKIGLSPQDIADSINMSRSFVLSRIKSLKQSKRISDEEIQNSRKLCKTILEMLENGRTCQSIADDIGKSFHFVYSRIQELKKLGKISAEEIYEATPHAKKQKQKQLQSEKQQKNQRLKTKQNLIKKHHSLKLSLERDGIDTPMHSVQFVSNCEKMFQLGIFPLEDVTLLRKVIEYTSITSNNINFMSRVYVHFKQYDEGIRFLNRCIGYLTEEADLIELSKKARNAISHFKKQQMAVSLLKSSYSIEFICSSTGLSEAEVVMLKNKITNSNDEHVIVLDSLEPNIEL